MVLSKKRRNAPKQTKILVTLPDVTAGQLVVLYTRRWHVELLIKELKGATGLGQAQVTKQTQRVERSVALSVMAYLVLIHFRQRDIPHQGPWSALPSSEILLGSVRENRLNITKNEPTQRPPKTTTCRIQLR